MKILLTDDHAIVRQSLQFVIQQHFPEAICEEAADGQSCIEKVKKQDFDLIILDMNLPDMDGITITEWILDRNREQKILFFTSSSTEAYAKKLYQMGIMGFINKQANLKDVAIAVQHIVIDKKQYLDEEFKSMLASDFFDNKTESPLAKFSARELSIAQLLANGKTFEEISAQLNIETSTIRTYKTRIFQKMDVNSLHEFLGKAKLYKII
jgi:DNA-binding NarL/FixJ family response regulator